MKTIIVNSPKYGNKKILLDDGDYERVSAYRWGLNVTNNKHFCIRRLDRPRCVLGKFLLGIIGSKKTILYVNKNFLDNRRSNMMVGTRSSTRKFADRKDSGSSKYLGVSYHKASGKYNARIMFLRKNIHLGLFKKEKDAALAYDEAAKKYHKGFANLNFK